MQDYLTNISLNFRTGPLKGTTVPLTPPRMIIGRDLTCHLKLNDSKVSRIHALLEVRGDEIIFRDNHSTNGSLLNGEPAQRAILKPGDVLTIGLSEIHLLENTDFRSISLTTGESVVHSSVALAAVSREHIAEQLTAPLELANR